MDNEPAIQYSMPDTEATEYLSSDEADGKLKEFYSDATGDANHPYNQKGHPLHKDYAAHVTQLHEIAAEAKETGEEKCICFCLSGHGLCDLGAYDKFFAGELEDYAYPQEKIEAAIAELPEIE